MSGATYRTLRPGWPQGALPGSKLAFWNDESLGMTPTNFAPGGLSVLFLAPFGEIGGSEMVLLRVMEDLDPEIRARAVLLGPGALEGMLTKAGIEVSVEPMPGKQGVLRIPSAAKRWSERLAGEGVHVIHANQAKAALFGIPLARRLNVPLLWMKHDHFSDGRAARQIAGRCDHVVCVSEAMARQFRGELANRVSVIYPGVRMPPPPSPRLTEPVIATVGRLDPLKGFDAIIRATRVLRDRGYDARARLAGPVDRVYPHHAEELHDIVRDLGLTEHVTIGFVDDLDAHYRDARVLVLSSPPKAGGLPSEGAPTVLMEAMSHATAVAAARQPGTEEVMGDVGTLVTDLSPEGWADALEPYLASPELAVETGRQGRHWAEERFSMSHTVSQLEGLYAQLAERGRLPRERRTVVRRPAVGSISAD